MRSGVSLFVLVLLALASATPAAVGRTAHDALVENAVLLESLASAEQTSASATAELDRIDARLAALDLDVRDDPVLQAKHAAVEGLAWLVRHGRIADPSISSVNARPAARLDGVAGATCATAIELPPVSTARYVVRAGDVLWFKVSSAGLSPMWLSTRGSTVDPALEVYEDCRTANQPRLLRVDDSIGLQADVPLSPESRTYWLVRASVLAGTGELAMGAGSGVRFEGRVTDEASGAPLAGVGVTAHRVVNGNTQIASSGFTNDDGRYAIVASTGFGTYAIRTGDDSGSSPLIHEAHNNLRCTQQQTFNFFSCGSTPSNSFTPINVTGTAPTIIDFALQQGGVLTGTITSSTGGPVEFARVELRDTVGLYSKITSTDAAGRYRILGVPPTSLRLEASSPEHALTRHQGLDCTAFGVCSSDAGTPVVIPPGTQARIDMTLRRLPVIEVDVTIDGLPITPLPQGGPANVMVEVLDSSGFALTSGMATPTNPRARIGPLQPGTYRVRATSQRAFPQLYPNIPCASDCRDELAQGAIVTIAPGSTGVLLAMDVQPVPQISGRVTEEGSGLAINQADVRLIRVGDPAWYSTVTAAGGNYLFAAVPPGQYHLRFASDRHVDEAHDNLICIDRNVLALCPGSTLITIDRSTADLTIDAALRRSASVTGRVALDGRFGDALGITFDLLTPSGVTVASWSTSAANAGNYALEDVPAGNWLLAAKFSFDSIPQLYRGVDCINSNGFDLTSCPFALATPIQVADQSTMTGIDFSLRRAGTRSVRVVDDASGLPIPGVSIDLWDTAGRHVATSVTDSEGRGYARLPPWVSGPVALSTDNALGYRDEVFDNIGCAIGSVFFGGCALTGYTPIVLPATSTTPPITIGLSRRDELFIDGFESR